MILNLYTAAALVTGQPQPKQHNNTTAELAGMEKDSRRYWSCGCLCWIRLGVTFPSDNSMAAITPNANTV